MFRATNCGIPHFYAKHSLRGARLEADTPFGHWRTQTFIAGLRLGELAAPWVLDGPMNRVAFETYIETQLAPCLRVECPGSHR